MLFEKLHTTLKSSHIYLLFIHFCFIYITAHNTWKWTSLSCIRLYVTPVDYTAHGILQARVLEWVAFLFFRGSFQPKGWT